MNLLIAWIIMAVILYVPFRMAGIESREEERQNGSSCP